MPSTAAWSAASLSPRPTSGAAASAAASVTRTSSRARFRSGSWRVGSGLIRLRDRITPSLRLRSWPDDTDPTDRTPPPSPRLVALDRRPMTQTAIVAEPENPLVAGLERQPLAPTALVIFGATGDLARRKLLPALYNLAHEGALPERFHLVGVSRKEQENDDYREQCEQAIRRFSRRTPDEDVLAGFLENVNYVPGEFDEESVYAELEQVLDGFDREAGEALNRAFYLST